MKKATMNKNQKQETPLYKEYQLRRNWIDEKGEEHAKGSIIRRFGNSWCIGSTPVKDRLVFNTKWCIPNTEETVKVRIIKTNDLLELNVGDVLTVTSEWSGYKYADYVRVDYRMAPATFDHVGMVRIVNAFEDSTFLSVGYLISMGYAEYETKE